MKHISLKLKSYWIKYYPYVCFVLLTLLIMLPQLLDHAYFAGTDSWFHANQYYDAMKQLQTGHFSYFISIFGFHRIGRIVNAVYGAYFMYLNGLLLWLAHTWYNFEIIQDILYLFLTGFIFYILCRSNHIHKSISTCLSLIYMVSTPIILFITNQEYIGWGALLVPLVMWQGTKIYRNKLNWIQLGVVMGITLQINPLSTLLGGIILLPFFTYSFFRTVFKRELVYKISKAFGLFILLTLNVLGSMLNVLPQHLILPVPQGYPDWENTLTFLNPIQLSVINVSESLLILITLILGLIACVRWSHTDNLIKIVYGLNLFTLWISSAYFPWHLLLKVYPAFKYQIQYPKRFLSVGLCCTLFLLGLIIQQECKELSINHQFLPRNLIIFFGTIVLSCFVFGGLINTNSMTDFAVDKYNRICTINYGPFYTTPFTKHKHKLLQYEYHHTNSAKPLNIYHQDTPDYLPTTNNVSTYNKYRKNGSYYWLQHNYYANHKSKYSYFPDAHKSLIHNGIKMSWNQKHTRRMILPFVKYHDTNIKLNHHFLKHTKITHVGAIENIKVHKGKNIILVRYHTNVLLPIAIIISLFSWIFIIGLGVKIIIGKLV